MNKKGLEKEKETIILLFGIPGFSLAVGGLLLLGLVISGILEPVYWFLVISIFCFSIPLLLLSSSYLLGKRGFL